MIACRSRRSAYDQFCVALSDDDSDAWLLVDAEDPVASGPPFAPWTHVKKRAGDGWDNHPVRRTTTSTS